MGKSRIPSSTVTARTVLTLVRRHVRPSPGLPRNIYVDPIALPKFPRIVQLFR